jgi:hypothetical protein
MPLRFVPPKSDNAPVRVADAEGLFLADTVWLEKCTDKMMNVLQLDKLVVSIPLDVLFQEVGEETVILSIESGNYFGLNPVASRIWSLFQEGRSMKEVIATTLVEFEVSEECLRADLQKFLGQLQSKGLITIHDVNGA